MEKLSAELVVQLTMFLALVGGFIAILKFLFSLKDEVTNLRVEMKEELGKLSIRVERLEFRTENLAKKVDSFEKKVDRLEDKFDGKEVAQKKLEESVVKIQAVQEVNTVQNAVVNERVEKIEYTVKESQKETNSILNKVLELLRSRDAVL